MRIRKRQVFFPLLPVTHSDPNLTNRSPVMVQLNDATQPSCTHGSPAAPSVLLDLSQPSDQPLPRIGKPTNGSDEFSGGTQYLRQQHKKQEESLVEDGMRKEEEKRGQKGNDIRKGSSISCSETFSPPSPPKQEERWCEEDKSFPPKKRRGNFENVSDDNNSNEDNDKKMNPKAKVTRMKTKMNRNYSERNDSNEGEEEEEEKEKEVTRETKAEANINVGKKRVRGGALMEGSRCSRVNGRGWRCCQQTLVGYSLCEHHLGKGRLRSMTSVRNKSIGTSNGATKNNNININTNKSKSEPEKQTIIKSDGVNEPHPLGNDAQISDEKKPVIVTKRRMKLGMVKARSISSLLGQTNTEVVAIAEDNNDHK
ncbi:hypothetical protein VNO78_21232 [Psophocarpus tetragonolobus]|uniref:WRC domain-containing protein n=1 Tax=Psophocarpus tetragonolobus TaxID=3891 RepID=A0AAN9XHX1_PSOTE